ncbi:MAG: AI-2E family transporter [Polyangiaceae bacterium]|nr:AI-2E family transporter [Polyangiaceae bacterium]
MSEVRTFPQGSHDKKRQRRLFLTISAITAVAVLLVANDVLLPFVLALVVAYILLPLVLRIERHKVPRFAAILIVYTGVLGAIAGFIAIIVPSLIQEGRALRKEFPHYIQEAEHRWIPALEEKIRAWKGGDGTEEEAASDTPAQKTPVQEAPLVIKQRPDGAFEVQLSDQVEFRRVGDDTWRVEKTEQERDKDDSQTLFRKMLDRGSKYLSENTVEVLKFGQQIISAVARGIFTLFMTLMLGAYIMLTHEKILGFFRELLSPESQPAMDRLLRRLDRGLSGVVRGQLFICLVNGVLSAIGFWLFDLKYWPLMSLLAAVGSLIPIFGSILSAIPAVAIGLTQSPGTALAVLAWILGIHQIEANFLNPKIIGDAAKIHPVLVVFSLLVGEHFFQIKGALFAVPCMSIAQTIFLHFRETTMGLRDPTATGHPELMAPPSGRPPPDQIPPGVNRS